VLFTAVPVYTLKKICSFNRFLNKSVSMKIVVNYLNSLFKNESSHAARTRASYPYTGELGLGTDYDEAKYDTT